MQLLDKFRWNVLKIGYIFVHSYCEETVSWGDRGEHDEGCVQLAVHSSGLGRRQTEEGHWKSTNGKCLAFFSVLSQICRSRDLFETFHSLFLLGIPACRRLLFLCKWSSEPALHVSGWHFHVVFTHVACFLFLNEMGCARVAQNGCHAHSCRCHRYTNWRWFFLKIS